MTQTPIQRERLERTADVLERWEEARLQAVLPLTTFDLVVWKEERKCGYAACAVGAICLLPWFREQGLVLGNDGLPTFAGLHSFRAVAEFFGFKGREEERLFHQFWYEVKPTPQEVAQRIRTWLADNPIPQPLAVPTFDGQLV
jgi:hypothetical protein